MVVLQNDGIKMDGVNGYYRLDALFENNFLFYESIEDPVVSGRLYIESRIVLNIPDLGLVGKFKGDETGYISEPWRVITFMGETRKAFDIMVVETITNIVGQRFTVKFYYRVMIEHSMYTDMDKLDEFIMSSSVLRMERKRLGYKYLDGKDPDKNNPYAYNDSDSESETESEAESEFSDEDRERYGTRFERQKQRNRQANKAMFDRLTDEDTYMHSLAITPFKATEVPGQWTLFRVEIKPEEEEEGDE